MSETYEEYENEYIALLAKIRSFLAGTRSHVTLQECERLLAEAKRNAGAMQGLAEVEGNAMKIREASLRLERDIAPLSREIKRAIGKGNREELFYQAPNGNENQDMESLIQGTEDMLRDSQALCLETEQIGDGLLNQMTYQREQLQTTRSNIDATREYASQAGVILTSMSRKALKNKAVLYALIGILLVSNVLAFLKIFR
ncbi:MAG: hypothetical protein SGBAC_010375 [Bacillariaceae sp.]